VPQSFQKDTQAEIFIVRQDISCNDPAEKQFYSCKKFDLICCQCESTEPDAPVNEEMKRQYRVPVPLFGKGRQASRLRTEHGNSVDPSERRRSLEFNCVKSKLHFDS